MPRITLTTPTSASQPTRARKTQHTMTSQILADITVPDTPLITAALKLARAHLTDWSYNHIVRSWLLGFAIADRDPDLKDRDRDLHAVAAILHDLGWVEKQAFVSLDKRFEVDGAEAVRDFIGREASGEGWDQHRRQVLWDAIALHTSSTIAIHNDWKSR